MILKMVGPGGSGGGGKPVEIGLRFGVVRSVFPPDRRVGELG